MHIKYGSHYLIIDIAAKNREQFEGDVQVF